MARGVNLDLTTLVLAGGGLLLLLTPKGQAMLKQAKDALNSAGGIQPTPAKPGTPATPGTPAAPAAPLPAIERARRRYFAVANEGVGDPDTFDTQVSIWPPPEAGEGQRNYMTRISQMAAANTIASGFDSTMASRAELVWNWHRNPSAIE